MKIDEILAQLKSGKAKELWDSAKEILKKVAKLPLPKGAPQILLKGYPLWAWLLAALIGVWLLRGLLGGLAGLTARPPSPGDLGEIGAPVACPYEGTWRGKISGSGVAIYVYRDGSGRPGGQLPYDASYDLTLKFECRTGAFSAYDINVTYAQVSHPSFNCSQGCVPDTGPWAYSLDGEFTLPEPGSQNRGDMRISFPSGSLGGINLGVNSAGTEIRGKGSKADTGNRFSYKPGEGGDYLGLGLETIFCPTGAECAFEGESRTLILTKE